MNDVLNTLIDESILCYDIETDSLDIEQANVKWFGAYSYKNDEYYLFDYNDRDKAKKLLQTHRVLIGFNNKGFDDPILLNNEYHYFSNNKVTIDLLEQLGIKGNSEYNKFFKNKLAQMGIKNLPNYKLKTIIERLKLDDVNKGDIDYKIFHKDEWTEDEIIEIKKYLKQDIILTKKLFEWYEEQFKPLKKFLPIESRKKFKHLTSSFASLSYEIMCNIADLDFVWEQDDKIKGESFEGGHHVNPRWNKVKGNIVNIDFTSAYPHALMMGNLFSPSDTGWDGKPYFNIKGIYNNKQQGLVEKGLNMVFNERLKAKRSGDKFKSNSYKIVINSLYGLTGNPKFKSLYNPTTVSDCTSMVRTWMKKLAKILEEHNFQVLYGFTDNLIVKIPEKSNEERLLYVVNKFIEEVKSNVPFPLDTFGMDLETRMKFIWFVSTNCYLWINEKDEIEYKSTLLNKNTPDVIMSVFNEYMKPKIVSEQDINFTKKEIIDEIIKRIEINPELAGATYSVSDKESYKIKSSLQYQVSEKYGEGKHILIPNNKMIGIGKGKSFGKGVNKTIPLRYCNIKEFNENNLKVSDINIKNLLQHLKEFIKIKKLNQQLNKFTQ